MDERRLAGRNGVPVEGPERVGRRSLRSGDRLGPAQQRVTRSTLEVRSRLQLTSTGGLGKTRLVSELALRECESFDYGAWIVELGSVTSPAAAAHSAVPLPELAQALAVREVELRRRGTPDRQSSLDSLVRWSLGLLEGPELDAVLALTVFPGRFTSAMGLAVIEPLGGGSGQATLDALVRKSLVDLDGDELRLLVTIRDCPGRRCP